MNEHIKLFETHSDYEEYINSQDKILPNVSFCKDLEEVHYNEKPHDYSQDYLTFVIKTGGTFGIYPMDSDSVYYSLDNGETWINFLQGGEIVVSTDDKLMWKGTLSSGSRYWAKDLGTTAHFDVQGNIMSLLYGDNFKGQTDLTNKGFGDLFSEWYVENAENLILPATTLSDNCYYSMFSECTSLVKAPKLPATTLANECYSLMFFHCSSLTKAPELPATTLASSCYMSMFQGCTSLTKAPDLPATELAPSCYEEMFQDCTNLRTAPDLLAMTRIPYTAYQNMFYDCSALASIKCLATSRTTPEGSWTTSLNFVEWVHGVNATGQFIQYIGANWMTGENGIPSGWTVQTASN